MTTPLSRNRNYQLLWGTQAVSEVGFHATLIAFPLLVLAITDSPAAAGMVLAAVATAQLVAGLPAGALVDRWNRKKIMVWCEAGQAIALGSLVLALWWEAASVPHLVAVALALGLCRSLFEPAEDASLPNLVAERQLSTAIAMNSARSSLGQMSGTALGGFLFAVGRWVPFVADLLTHVVAFVGLLFLRVPARRVEPQPIRRLVHETVEGLHWVWRRREIRVTTACAVALNLFFNAFYLVIIVLAQGKGVPSGEIGVMAAMLGAGGITGALLAPYLLKILTPYTSIAVVFWLLTALTPTAIVIDSGYLMGALLAAMVLLAPTANTTINTHQLLLTPDDLRGRLSGVLNVATGTAAALGPALGGVLVELAPATTAVLVCAAGMAAVTVLVTISPTLRHYPQDARQRKETVT